MSKNPSYARFEYTYNDVMDCLAHIDDELEGDEKVFRDRLVKACQDIVERYDNQLMGFDDEDESEDE